MYDEEESVRAKSRRKKMINEHSRREIMKKKLYDEKQNLSQLHLITHSQELDDELLKIDMMSNISAPQIY